MPELRCKSIRMDKEFTAAQYDEIWSWAPDRDIKIKAVQWTMDIPGTYGTMWLWLSKGAVGMVSPTPGPNEEEMIISTIHCRAQLTPDGFTGHAQMFTNFGANYMEVEEGEKLYVLGRGDTGGLVGFDLCIYYH